MNSTRTSYLAFDLQPRYPDGGNRRQAGEVVVKDYDDETKRRLTLLRMRLTPNIYNNDPNSRYDVVERQGKNTCYSAQLLSDSYPDSSNSDKVSSESTSES